MLIKNLKYFLIVSGTWNDDWTETASSVRVRFWYRRSLKITMFIFLLSTLIRLIQLILLNADGEVIYPSASVLLTSLGMGIKLLIYERKNVKMFFKEIKNEEKGIDRFLDREIVKSYTRDVQTFIKLKNGMVYGIVLASIMFFLFSSVNFMKANAMERSEKELLQESLMYPIWFPCKQRDSVTIVTILNIIFTFTAANIYLATHLITFTLMVYAAAKLKMLQVLIRGLGTTNYKNINHYNALSIIAVKHLSAISFVKKLNSHTGYVMLTNFLLNSMNVASVVIEVLMKNTLREAAFPMVHLLHLVINVFLLGWFANEINVQNHALGDVLYQTKWYNYDIKTQKLVLFILRQSQRPLTLSIGKFGNMTLETAIKTMQAAYSYVTLMRNFQ